MRPMPSFGLGIGPCTAFNTIAFPVLGRAGFFEQVDVTFAELERMLYLRFRNPAISRLFA